MAVWDAFCENFAVEDELGAACSLVVDGEIMVDIWGGFARADQSAEWERETTVCMMSVAKGMTGIAFNMLADRGPGRFRCAGGALLAAFAQGGKAGITVRMLPRSHAPRFRC